LSDGQLPGILAVTDVKAPVEMMTEPGSLMPGKIRMEEGEGAYWRSAHQMIAKNGSCLTDRLPRNRVIAIRQRRADAGPVPAQGEENG